MAKREKKRHHDWHHRKPRSLGGDSSDRNMSHVSVSKHRAYHILFSNMTPEQIAKVLNKVWLDPDWKLTAHCTVIEDE
jgi:hypothetical protein